MWCREMPNTSVFKSITEWLMKWWSEWCTCRVNITRECTTKVWREPFLIFECRHADCVSRALSKSFVDSPDNWMSWEVWADLVWRRLDFCVSIAQITQYRIDKPMDLYKWFVVRELWYERRDDGFEGREKGSFKCGLKKAHGGSISNNIDTFKSERAQQAMVWWANKQEDKW